MRGGRGASPEARGSGVVAAHKRHARGKGPTQGLRGPRARAERTKNMRLMSVTLEVSKLSGWLKADARCRVEGRAHAMRGGEVRAGRRVGLWGVVAAHKRHARGKGPTQGSGAKGTRGVHVEHVVHVCDAGGVEAQQLVEIRHFLPSRRKGMRCGGRGASREAGGPGVRWRHTKDACTGKARLKAWGGHGHARSAQRTCCSCL